MSWRDASGWMVAAVLLFLLLRNRRQWRQWASRIATYVNAQRGGRTATLPAAWTDEQEAVRLGLQRWMLRMAEADGEVGRLSGVIEGMVEGVVVIDGDGRVVLANARAKELLDLPRATAAEGRLLAELSRHPDLLAMVRAASAERHWIEPMVEEFLVGPAQDVTLRVTASRLPAREGMDRWFVLVFHDISSIRQLERMRRDFVANVSHELRTPLAAIGGYTETLLAGAMDDPDKARRFLGIIERHSDRLGRLVDDLLTLSDLELGCMELSREAQHVRTVVDRCFETLRSKADSAGVTLESAVSEDLPAVDADADRLEQALLNLIDNAIKYTSSGGCVRVAGQGVSGAAVAEATALGGDRFVEISVSDTGVGVPPDDLARLTERFYRVDKARSRALGGTGLGLAIVKHIVQAHGGWMRIESELDRGTTVRLYLPPAGEEALVRDRRDRC